MPEWPNVDIVLITYDRFNEILDTIEALVKNLDYPTEKLRWLIADDATPGDYLARLANTETFWHLKDHEFVPTPDGNRGWGGNVNRALRYSTAPYIFQIEDDYILKKPLNLKAAVAAMQVTPHMGMMRFRGTAGDHLVYHQMEARIGDWLPDYQEGVGLQGRLSYFLIDSGSPGLYIYSHGAHLKRNMFHKHYGAYPEGLKLGHTEESYAHMVKDMMKANPYSPVICIQPEWIAMHFDHIGKSRQLTDLDIERKVLS